MKVEIIMPNVNSFRFLAVGLLLLTFCTTGFSQSVLTLNQQKQQESNQKMIPLEKLIKRIESDQQIAFLYKTRWLKDKYVPSSILVQDSLEFKLGVILQKEGLTYSKITSRSYAIQPQTGMDDNATESVQAETVTGTVTDAQTGETLPGVNILVKGTTTGASTNADGNFELTVESLQDTLVVTFIGYQKQEVPINGRSTINIVMQTQTISGDEVVVTALGITRSEKSLGYSVQEVGGDEINDSPEIGVVSSLAAKTAGVQITDASGQPGSSSRITIRGSNSITGNNQPLFVIDGIPISNTNNAAPGGEIIERTGSGSNRALDIDPSIIKDITVLKGGSATALYGSRAANGVVQITTKGGQSGQMEVNFNSKLRFDKAILDGTQDEYLTGQQGYFANGLPSDRGGYIEPGYPGSDPQTGLSWGPHKSNVSQQVLNDLGVDRIQTNNLLNDFYQRGTSTDYSLAFSGGDENGTYYLSGSLLDQTGTVPSTLLNKKSLNAKVSRDITDNLESETRVNYTNTHNEWQRNGYPTLERMTRIWPINLQAQPYEYEDGMNITLGGVEDSPFWMAGEKSLRSSVNRLILAQKLTYNLTPWLTIIERFGLDTYTDSRKEEQNRRQRFINDGLMYENSITNTELNNDLMLDIREIQIVGGLSVSATVGNNINSRYSNNVGAIGNNQNIPDFFHISNFSGTESTQYTSRRHLISLYSEAVLSFEDYLFLTLTGRNDWSSTLPKDNRSYFYPSGSLGFVFSDLLGGITENTPLSYGKIRASLSQTGNDAPVYSLSPTYVKGNFTAFFESRLNRQSFIFPFNGISSFLESGVLGNPELKPEITTSYEVGINLGFYDGRANIDATYYNQTTENQIYSTPVSTVTGYTNLLRNAGEIRNKGVELTLSGSPIETQDFQWNLIANWSKNRNEVISLAPGVQRIALGGYGRIGAQKGEGYGNIRGSGYNRNEQGEYIIQDDPDANGYGFPVESDLQKTIGNIQPDWQGNLRSTFRYKGFTLSGLLDMKHGGDVVNFDLNYTIERGMAEITEQRGTQMTNPDQPGYIEPYVWKGVKQSSGESNDIELLRDQNFWERYGQINENTVEDGSYIKLREVSLGYSLPSTLLTKTPLRTAALTVTGRNLWIKSDFSYGDPEGSTYGSVGNADGFYFFVTPTSRSLVFNLKLGF